MMHLNRKCKVRSKVKSDWQRTIVIPYFILNLSKHISYFPETKHWWQHRKTHCRCAWSMHFVADLLIAPLFHFSLKKRFFFMKSSILAVCKIYFDFMLFLVLLHIVYTSHVFTYKIFIYLKYKTIYLTFYIKQFIYAICFLYFM